VVPIVVEVDEVAELLDPPLGFREPAFGPLLTLLLCHAAMIPEGFDPPAASTAAGR
jgi:hypothetical protein